MSVVLVADDLVARRTASWCHLAVPHWPNLAVSFSSPISNPEQDHRFIHQEDAVEKQASTAYNRWVLLSEMYPRS